MGGICRTIWDDTAKTTHDSRTLKSDGATGCRTIYINGSFVTSKQKPNDFDACWDRDDVDIDYIRIHAPKLLNHLDRQAQKNIYFGEIFRSDEPVGDLGLNSFEFFQRDRQQNRKGIIAIDLVRWEP